MQFYPFTDTAAHKKKIRIQNRQRNDIKEQAANKVCFKLSFYAPLLAIISLGKHS